MSKALIVIDMQNDFITGSLGSPEAQAIVPAVRNRIKEALMEGVPVIYTQDTHGKDYLQTFEGSHLPVIHCVKDTDGWAIYPDVYSPNAACVVTKPTFGYLNWDATCIVKNSDVLLSDVDEIELLGICTDICVVTNALILRTLYPDTTIVVDANLCAGTTPENHQAALKVMKSCQIEIRNMPS